MDKGGGTWTGFTWAGAAATAAAGGVAVTGADVAVVVGAGGDGAVAAAAAGSGAGVAVAVAGGEEELIGNRWIVEIFLKPGKKCRISFIKSQTFRIYITNSGSISVFILSFPLVFSYPDFLSGFPRIPDPRAFDWTR